jgi:sec-independent protein translocase protein TatB
MFGIGGSELLIILIVALLVLGPEKLPGLARTLGKAMGELRRTSADFQRALNLEAAMDATRPRKKDKAPGAAPKATPKATPEIARPETAPEAMPDAMPDAAPDAGKGDAGAA